MDAIATLLITLLASYVPGDFVCRVVEANPAAIEIFCANEQTGKLKFALIERTGVIVIVDGLSI